jgi:hypothetical protein
MGVGKADIGVAIAVEVAHKRAQARGAAAGPASKSGLEIGGLASRPVDLSNGRLCSAELQIPVHQPSRDYADHDVRLPVAVEVTGHHCGVQVNRDSSRSWAALRPAEVVRSIEHPPTVGGRFPQCDVRLPVAVEISGSCDNRFRARL